MVQYSSCNVQCLECYVICFETHLICILCSTVFQGDIEKGLEMKKLVLSGFLASEEIYINQLEALLLVSTILPQITSFTLHQKPAVGTLQPCVWDSVAVWSFVAQYQWILL